MFSQMSPLVIPWLFAKIDIDQDKAYISEKEPRLAIRRALTSAESAMEQKIPDNELKVLEEIEDAIFKRMRPGVDWSELWLLDNVNTQREAIEKLGARISTGAPELLATILRISHAIYFSFDDKSAAPDFFDAVIRLGGDRVKMLLFAVNLFSLGKGRDARTRAAKSASIGILGKVIAEEMNLNDDLVRKVETGGLLSQLGRSLLMKARELGMDVSDKFIDRYERSLAIRLIDRLQLDPFLKHVIELSSLEFDEESLTLAGIIKLAESITEDSFRKYGKLVVRSPMPDEKGIVSRTPGETIRQLFSVLGVEEFLEIQEVPTRRQLELREKRKRK